MDYVQTNAQLAAVASTLEGVPLVAADTEAAGYHRYHDRVCLLQLSTRTNTFLVDTLAVEDLHPLRPLLEGSDCEVVFHDADYDLRLLDRDYGLVVRRLFDTKIAAQFVGEPAFGLASLAEKYLGVKLEKKYQRADWAQRPLPPELLEYAAQDTRYLPELRDRLREALVARGRLAWAEEEFRLQEQVRWTPTRDEDAYRRLKGTRDLRPLELAALREVFRWRERQAKTRDVAPFRVLSNDALVELARRMPESSEALERLPAVPRVVRQRYGAEIVAAVERARRLSPDELPVRERGPGRPPPDPEFEAAVDRLRAARDAAAERLGLDRGFVMPRTQLEELARERPRTLEELAALPGVRRWQVEAAGPELIAALAA